MAKDPTTPTVFRKTKQRNKKLGRKCDSCGTTILLNEFYWYIVGMLEGDFCYTGICQLCFAPWENV